MAYLTIFNQQVVGIKSLDALRAGVVDMTLPDVDACCRPRSFVRIAIVSIDLYAVPLASLNIEVDQRDPITFINDNHVIRFRVVGKSNNFQIGD